jgi:hypothetical protein
MTTYDYETTTNEAVRNPKWCLGTVLKVWAAAALPIAIPAWVVSPCSRTPSPAPPA